MGKGNAFNEHGDETVETGVDNEQCPLDEATNFNTYMDLKPPERLGKTKTIKIEIVAGQHKYARHSDEKKKYIFPIS
ncbi:hypothetical protein BD560DRAFT_336555 [Blakeslea trispora]|nr:hypothetical protein BD560DRAFT_336555 [Blakeslea trispora]